MSLTYSLILMLLLNQLFVQINSKCDHKYEIGNHIYNHNIDDYRLDHYGIMNSTCHLYSNDIEITGLLTDTRDDLSNKSKNAIYLHMEFLIIPTFKTNSFMSPWIACYYGNIHLYVEDCHVQKIANDGFPHEVQLYNLNNNYYDVSGHYYRKCNVSYRSITFHNNNIQTINSEIFSEWTNLAIIDLASNNIQKLAEYAFDNLPELTKLILSNNNISTISNTFRMLDKIETLDVSRNEIVQLLPNMFDNLKSLTHLNISNNKIDEISFNTFTNLNQLDTLDLANNRLITININAFSGLTSLQTLILNENRLVDIKYLLIDIPQIQYLDIGGNEIERTDMKIFSGHQLKCINIDENKYSCLELIHFLDYFKQQPIKIIYGSKRDRNCIVSYDSITMDDSNSDWEDEDLNLINLENNNITKLEQYAFDNLPKLIRYDSITMHDSNISTINTRLFSDWEDLTLINLENNNITNLEQYAFDNLPKLTTLILSNNNISTISEAFRNLSVIQTLDMAQNKINQIFPKVFDNLTSLIHLNLSGNEIQEIPRNTFIHLNQLDTLDLSINRLTTINMSSFSGLHSLRALYLKGNRLVNVNKYLLINTQQLRKLDISYNGIETIDKDLFAGHQLSSINIDGNKFSCLELENLNNYFKTQQIRMQYGLEKDRSSLFGIHCNDTEEDNTMISSRQPTTSNANELVKFFNRGFKETNFYKFFNNFTNLKLNGDFKNMPNEIYNDSSVVKELQGINSILVQNAKEIKDQKQNNLIQILKEIKAQRQNQNHIADLAQTEVQTLKEIKDQIENKTDNANLISILLQILKEIKGQKQYKIENVEKTDNHFNETEDNSFRITYSDNYNEQLIRSKIEKYIQENHGSITSNALIVNIVIVCLIAIIIIVSIMYYYGIGFKTKRKNNSYNVENAISRTELTSLNDTL